MSAFAVCASTSSIIASLGTPAPSSSNSPASARPCRLIRNAPVFAAATTVVVRTTYANAWLARCNTNYCDHISIIILYSMPCMHVERPSIHVYTYGFSSFFVLG